jgi:hypothetical protein
MKYLITLKKKTGTCFEEIGIGKYHTVWKICWKKDVLIVCRWCDGCKIWFYVQCYWIESAEIQWYTIEYPFLFLSVHVEESNLNNF